MEGLETRVKLGFREDTHLEKSAIKCDPIKSWNPIKSWIEAGRRIK